MIIGRGSPWFTQKAVSTPPTQKKLQFMSEILDINSRRKQGKVGVQIPKTVHEPSQAISLTSRFWVFATIPSKTAKKTVAVLPSIVLKIILMDKEDAEPLLYPRIAPKDGKLLKRWNKFIPRKGTFKPSSKVILPKVVFRISRLL
ncbi:hypothetical protein OUZ56_026280 [Daphnia magna]|uniref:Uncharacterized protein n=1 Tax=Daphnia magna TaxID=35525 RepID=A0ABQ9ZLF9_9CRUS|nr:hypothetical protein OUZ56_026280 [Daphnia magna]